MEDKGHTSKWTYIEEDKEDDEFQKQVQHSVQHLPVEERPAQKSQNCLDNESHKWSQGKEMIQKCALPGPLCVL